ncbi:hypothetical protein C4K24_0085 [Pseudomonas chlororaphis subsp. aurantiaca]|nr:hypothetical protein C4K24_0085 [Pseudomonas chlororaphis subsp. aurantiaca]AZD45538.1 hypothetical protein C4K20_0085 [Pseudomonas chlororaphis subsp. aurantiaca]
MAQAALFYGVCRYTSELKPRHDLSANRPREATLLVQE